MGNTQFNHAVLARVAKSLMRSCGVRTRITCVFHRVNFKWAQCASPQPAPSHLEFALTLIAHALGFGIYREGGLIQMFDEPQLWDDVGYEVAAGQLAPTETVTLRRRQTATPRFFAELLDPKDAARAKVFANAQEQAKWVAVQIAKNIDEDELEPSDIVVIFADPVSVSSDAGPLVAELRKRKINSHIAGVTRSVDEFVVNDSVANGTVVLITRELAVGYLCASLARRTVRGSCISLYPCRRRLSSRGSMRPGR